MEKFWNLTVKTTIKGGRFLVGLDENTHDVLKLLTLTKILNGIIYIY